jgi:adhesin/invasin
MSKIKRFRPNRIWALNGLVLLLALGVTGPLRAQTTVLAEIVPHWPGVIVVGVPYSMQFVLDPDNIGPHTAFEVLAGTILPPGLTFDPLTGILAGTATAAGMYEIDLRVDTIPASNLHAIILYPLLVVPPLSPARSVLPPGNVGTSYMAAVAQNGAPVYTFQLKTGSLPPGLAFDANTASLKGTPTAQGSYSFTATITDSVSASVTGSFSVLIGAAGNVYATTSSVAFQAMAGGAVQTYPVGVLATDLSAMQFAVSVPATAGGALPGWLKVTPTSGATPGQLSIQADPGSLAPGSYQTYIQVTAPGQGAITIGIALTVAASMQSFAVAPSSIDVTYPAGVDLTQPVTTTLQVLNNGAAQVSGTVVAEPPVSGTPWLSVSPSQFNLSPGQAQTFSVTTIGANTQGTLGKHFGFIDVKSAKQSLAVPVSIDIRASNAIPNISVTPQATYWFLVCDPNATPMGESYYVGQIGVENSGPTTAYTTSLQGFGSSIQVTPASGTDTGYINFAFDACKLGQGDHTGYLAVSAPKLTPSTVYQKWEICVGDFKNGNILGCPNQFSGAVSSDSGGLVMVSQGTAKPTTTITVTGSNGQPLNFSVGLNSGAPAGVTVSPTSFVATSSPTTVTLTADPAEAPATVVTEGQVLLADSGGFREPVAQALNWALVNTPAAPVYPSARIADAASAAAAACSPTQIVLVPATPSYFSQRVDWPMGLKARLVDDCGQAVNGASVTASFSNGDPGLALAPADSVSGIYAATWRPAAAASSVTVTLRAIKSGLPTVTRPVYGAVTGDLVSPIVTSGGVVNNLNPVFGALVAPGTVTAIYGSNLAASAVQATALPLPTTLGVTQVLIGGIAAPLFFVSPGQINAQIPPELPANSAVEVMVVANGNVSVPQSIRLGAVDPGIAAYASGRVMAQHGDYTLVTPDSPARPGEWIVFYLVGMGATSPAMASNQTAPSSTLTPATVQPKVSIDGVAAGVVFGGLTPGALALYQINCQVPTGARTGDLPLVVIQSDVAANPVTLPVAQ